MQNVCLIALFVCICFYSFCVFRKYGSELATIKSKWQQMEAQDALQSGKSQFDEQDAWIGFHQKTKFLVGGLWTWTGNNDIVTFKNWGLNQPQHAGDDNKRCAVMDIHSTSGVWESEDCGKQKWILCNAKEETPSMSMRDLIFPPRYCIHTQVIICFDDLLFTV